MRPRVTSVVRQAVRACGGISVRPRMSCVVRQAVRAYLGVMCEAYCYFVSSDSVTYPWMCTLRPERLASAALPPQIAKLV